jgi:protein-S-isoprenylcysteine O-methyltransferase Ste14
MGFKLVFILAFVLVAGIAGSTARTAAREHGGSLNQLSNEVRGLLFVRAVLGLVFYLGLAAWLFDWQWLRWTEIGVAQSLRIAASLLLCPVVLFLGWSFRSIGRNYRGGVGLHEHHQLVTSGAYRHIRHPIYVSFILIMILVLVISSNWLLGVSGLALVTSIAIGRVPIEERELAGRFGTSWASYAGRTGGFLPRRITRT